MERETKKHPKSNISSLLLVLAVFFLVIVGIYWLFGGLGNGNGKFILYGGSSLVLGFILAGRA